MTAAISPETSHVSLCEVHALIAKHNLPMKPLRIEVADDSCTVYFFSENRVDFRNLVKDINSLFGRPVRLHQVSPRDEAKMIGGIGACGKGLCCRSFLSVYEPLPLESLKKQCPKNSQSLGVCGKLQCCLLYEAEMKLVMREPHPTDLIKISEKPDEQTMPESSRPAPNADAVVVHTVAETKAPETPMPPNQPHVKHLIRHLTLKKQKHS